MSEAQDKATAFLENSVRDYKIFIDTSSLLSDYADAFWSHLVPVLQRESKSVIVPLRVYQELEKFANNPEMCRQRGKPELSKRARMQMNNIARLQKANLVQVFGDKSDNFADNVFQTVFTQFRLKYNLMLITQDRNLAADVMQIDKSKAVSTSNQIRVERINKYGYLSVNDPGRNAPDVSAGSNGRSSSNGSGRRSGTRAPIPENERFDAANVIQNVSGRMSVSSVPAKGDLLTAERGGDRRQIRLADPGPSGGEGTIYATEIPGVVAKIYKPEKLDRAKYEKLRVMMTKRINCEGVCFPLAILYNHRNEFVGYLMKEAMGKELQRCVFIPQLLKKTFPNWTRIDTVTLCVTILRKLTYLHERNIILGDINPNNILVVSPTEVYFVDTDSYQIEGFPCPVGTINYTAPEIQRKPFETFLRTQGNERFAVATLLFMIMLPGKPPYSLQGGENQIDNILNGDFAYASGERSNGRAPEGMWRFSWSHLPRFLKDDFYETFHKGGEHYTEQARFSSEDWLHKFENYLNLLKSGRLTTQDPMSIEIFPTRLKKNPKATYVKCRICGTEVELDRTEQGICRDCLKKGETYRCASCGREMVYTNFQKYVRGAPRYEICRECNEKKNQLYEARRCTECGRTFEITNGEKEFYDKKGYELPKKCKACRSQKPQSGSTRANAGWSSGGGSTGSGTRNSAGGVGTPGGSSAPSSGSRPSSSGPKDRNRIGSGGCYITTAVCAYLGKADDCYELTTLRWFRDEWLSGQPGGEASIRKYYETAPKVVDALDAHDERNEIYMRIWQDCIRPCIRMIEEGDYESCRVLYERMVWMLESKVLQNAGGYAYA